MSSIREHEKQKMLLAHNRLFFEEVFCDVIRHDRVHNKGQSGKDLEIWRNVYLGEAGSYADIFVQEPNGEKYYVEVKFGMSERALIEDLEREYGPGDKFHPGVSKVLILANPDEYRDWKAIMKEIKARCHKMLSFDVMSQSDLFKLIEQAYQLDEGSVIGKEFHEVFEIVEHAKWCDAFGDEHADSPNRDMALWNFSAAKLSEMSRSQNVEPHNILEPRIYHDCVVMMADLCSFSAYMRDSRDPDFTRVCMETYYSRCRTAIHNCGGMMYQVVGDEVVAIFGLHETDVDYLEQAMECARAVADIGYAVALDWQAGLDRVQDKKGVHIGMAIGDLSVVPYRPYSASHLGFQGETLNIAARLMGLSGPGESVISNMMYNRLPDEIATKLVPVPASEVKNMGQFQSWRMPARENA